MAANGTDWWTAFYPPDNFKRPTSALCDGCHSVKFQYCRPHEIEATVANVNVSAHTFQFITPAMTDQYNIPNPGTSCHKDKTTAWATDALRHWPERSPWRIG